MNDWNLWLNSSETRTALKTLKEAVKEFEAVMTSGCLIQKDSTDVIALQYAYSQGKLDGMRNMIETLIDIKDQEVEDD